MTVVHMSSVMCAYFAGHSRPQADTGLKINWLPQPAQMDRVRQHSSADTCTALTAAKQALFQPQEIQVTNRLLLGDISNAVAGMCQPVALLHSTIC